MPQGTLPLDPVIVKPEDYASKTFRDDHRGQVVTLASPKETELYTDPSTFRSYIEKSDAGQDEMKIEGWASTDQVDRHGDIVDPEAFRKHIHWFLSHPIMLLNHKFRELPLGTFQSVKIRENGLWVLGSLDPTDANKQVWILIERRTLRAFSIGFRGHKIEITDDDRPDVWREIELIEISVVNVPANPGALFAVAQERGLNLGCDSALITKGAEAMPVTAEVKTAVAERVKEVEPTLTAAAKDAAKSTATEIVVAKIDPLNASLDECKTGIVAIKDAIKGHVTEAELNAAVDKVKADFVGIEAQVKRLASEGIPVPARGRAMASNFLDVSEEGMTQYSKSFMAENKHADPLFAKAMSEHPSVYFSKDSEEYLLLKDLQEKATILHVMHILAFASPGGQQRFPTVKSLRYYDTYAAAVKAFRDCVLKAGPTTTGTNTGAEWLPTGMSASIWELVSRYTKLEDLFDHFAMKQKSVEWPFETAIPLAYLPGEATTVTEGTLSTDKVTLTAAKLAVYITTSSEWDEDAVVAGVPWLIKSIAKGLANGVEDCICQGDTATTHEDDDTQNPIGSTDRRKAFKGLKASANDGDGTISYATTATNADGAVVVADFRAIRSSMQEYGSDPTELAYILSVTQNIKILDATEVITLDKFGNAATILKGELAMLDGSPVRYSTGVPQNMGTSGVYDDTETVTDRTVAYAVHRPSWIIGDRRLPTMETGRILASDKIEILATRRLDMKSLAGGHGASGAAKNVWIVYNLAGD